MNNRLIMFIIGLLLAIMSAYTQENTTATLEESVSVNDAPSVAEKSPTLSLVEELPTIPAAPVPITPAAIASEETSTAAITQESEISNLKRDQKETTANQMQDSDFGHDLNRKVASQEDAVPLSNTIHIGLSPEVRQKVASILNKLLSDEFVLYTKALKFHWNVQGKNFSELHKLFKKQYKKLFKMIDAIAERARALGAPALGSLKEFSTYSRLKEMNSEKLSAQEMIKQLLTDHETIIRTIRDAIDSTTQVNDQGTNNFLQELLVKHEKMAWMLRASVQ